MSSTGMNPLSPTPNQVPTDAPPRYSTVFTNEDSYPPGYSSHVSARSRSHSPLHERRQDPSSRHKRHYRSNLAPDPIGHYSTLNPHSPDFALASNSAYPSFINGTARSKSLRRGPQPCSSSSLASAEVEKGVPLRHHFHLEAEGHTHRHLTITNDEQKPLFDVRIKYPSSYSRTYGIEIASMLPSALFSSSCNANIRPSARSISFTIHSQLFVVCSRESASNRTTNGIEFMSSSDLALLRWTNTGEMGQQDLLLQNSAGATIAHLTSWERGTKEKGTIQLLRGDMEQNVMEEIAISGLLALSEENRKKGSMGVGGEGRGKTANAAWLPSDYGMADWGHDCKSTSGYLSAGIDVASNILGAFQ